MLRNTENTFTGHRTSSIPLLVEQVAIAKYIHCCQTNNLVFPAHFEPLPTFYGFCLWLPVSHAAGGLWLFLSPHSAWRCLQEPLITCFSWKVSGLQLCWSRAPGTMDMILWVARIKVPFSRLRYKATQAAQAMGQSIRRAMNNRIGKFWSPWDNSNYFYHCSSQCLIVHMWGGGEKTMRH